GNLYLQRMAFGYAERENLCESGCRSGSWARLASAGPGFAPPPTDLVPAGALATHAQITCVANELPPQTRHCSLRDPMHFDLADLRLFIHIAESPSLTQGARRAHLSPAAASARIKALESQFDSRLLYRDSRGVELTPAGQKLLQHARLVMRQVEYLKSEFTEYGADNAGHIRIFANTTAVTEFLPEILADLLAQRPGVTVDLQEKLTRDIVRGVLDGSTDMGIIAGPVKATGLQAIHFSTDRLLLALPVGHALAGEQKVTLQQTLAYQHIGLHAGSTLLTFLHDQVERLGGKLSLRIQMSGFEAICRMIEA